MCDVRMFHAPKEVKRQTPKNRERSEAGDVREVAVHHRESERKRCEHSEIGDAIELPVESTVSTQVQLLKLWLHLVPISML